MRTVTGLFDTHEHAAQAVRDLRGLGIPEQDISMVASNGARLSDEDFTDDVAEGAGAGMGIGAALGGAGGLLAGIGALAIPGIGPVVAGGWLVSTAVGALAGAAVGGAAGGLIGALSDAGVDERDAHVYAESIRRGGTLVSARVNETQANAADGILERHERMDVMARRAQLEQEGWDHFDPDAEPYTPEQIRDYRQTIYNTNPPIA